MSDPDRSRGGGDDTGQPGDDRRVCAVCGRYLNAYISPEGDRSWMHTFADLPEDHPAVAVATDAGIIPRPRCDFCSDEDPGWTLPVRSFLFPGLPPGPTDNGSRGDWSACDICAELISRDQWTALRRRALTAWSTTHPDAAGQPEQANEAHQADQADRANRVDIDRRLGQMYRLLRRNITGPLRPTPPPTHIPPGSGDGEPAG